MFTCNSCSVLCVCSAIPSIVAFEKNDLKIVFHFERDPVTPSTIKITLNAINSCSTPMTDFLFQAAVPKVIVVLLLINAHHGVFADFSDAVVVTIGQCY